jgi:hypothetical protein
MHSREVSKGRAGDRAQDLVEPRSTSQAQDGPLFLVQVGVS